MKDKFSAVEGWRRAASYDVSMRGVAEVGEGLTLVSAAATTAGSTTVVGMKVPVLCEFFFLVVSVEKKTNERGSQREKGS